MSANSTVLSLTFNKLFNMKNLIFLIAILISGFTKSQTNDSTNLALKTGPFKVIVISPIEDPGIQNKPKCYTQVDYSADYCCHQYNVYCDGNLAWSGSLLCSAGCLFVTAANNQRTINPNENNPPTIDDQKKMIIKYDFSVTEGRTPLLNPLDEILYLKDIKKGITFLVEADTYVKMGDQTVIYKKGFYSIVNEKMEVQYYVQ